MSILQNVDRITTDTSTTYQNSLYGSGIYSQSILPSKREKHYREGVKTLSFRKTKAMKGLNPLPYFNRSITTEHLRGSFTVLWNPIALIRAKEVYGLDVPYNPFTTSGLIDQGIWICPELSSLEVFDYNTEWNRLHEKCNAKLLEKVKDMKIDLSVAFGTRVQTVEFIAETATKFFGTINHLRKGDLNGARRTLFGGSASMREIKKFKSDSDKHWYQTMANEWLQLQYAWSPMLSDIYAGMDLWKTFPKRPIKVIGQSEIGKTINQYDKGFHLGNINRNVTATHKLRVRETMFCSLDDNAISSLTTSASQIGLTNPALLAWDVLPFSFVVDWFLPLNGYLSSLDSMLGIKFLHTVVATKFESSLVNNFYGNGIYNVHDSKISGFARSSIIQKDFRRSISYYPPRPIFPSFKNPISTSHAMSALSLMIGLFTSNKR